MALSANASRALDQVKMGLYMLYGADYFTEDEWIKIDGLIHKGNYVFTQGPPRNVLEEELMSFDESKIPKPSDNVHTDSSDTFELIEKDCMQVSEKQTASPTAKTNLTSPSEHPTTPATSGEVSSDEEFAHPPPQQPTKEGNAMVDLFEMATPTPIKTVEEPVKPAETGVPPNGLSAGYTQAQLDEVKAFNAGLTKAGQKSRPKYTKEESYSHEGSDSGINHPNHGTEEVYQDPAPTPREIQTWANEVKAIGDVIPKASSVKSTASTSGWTASSPAPPRMPSKQALVEQFVKAHGRAPKSMNDIYQPNNAEYQGPKRVESRASTRTIARTVASKLPTQPNNFGKLKLDSIYIAQSSSPKTNQMALEVTAGDKIHVLKLVSGSVYNGMNLRTKEIGQCRESIFMKDPAAQLIEHQQQMAQKNQAVAMRKRAPSVSTTVSRRLDRVEHMNAAEWDEMPTVTRPKTVAPTPTRPAVGGLATSRFAMLADMDSKSESSEQQDVVPGMTQEQIEKLFDDKFDQILKSRNMNGNRRSPEPQPQPPTRPSRKRTMGKEPLQAVTPKTEICWFWGTPNKECRFTAEECRDLHSFVSTSGDPSNLRMGKPTWGALADTVPATASAAPPKAGLTCYFWATTGRCHNPTATCKYLHEVGTLGVARPPKGYRVSALHKDRSQWRGEVSNEGNEWGETDDGEEGELVIEEAPAWGGNGWGDETSDKYKPPHVKALEEHAKSEFSGW